MQQIETVLVRVEVAIENDNNSQCILVIKMQYLSE